MEKSAENGGPGKGEKRVEQRVARPATMLVGLLYLG